MPDSQYTPLSQEQLEFFAGESAHAARKATRKTLRTAFAGYLILFAGVLGMYLNEQSVSQIERDESRRAGRAVAIEGCNRDFTERTNIRALLNQARRNVERQYRAGLITDAQWDQAQDFYDKQLATFPLIDCRRSDDALEHSDNNIVLPKPLHP